MVQGKQLRILAIGDMRSGCYWARVKRPLEELRKLGHIVHLADTNQAIEVSGWDIVIFQNLLGGIAKIENGKEVDDDLINMVNDYRMAGAKIVYDTDDAQEVHPGYFRNETRVKECIHSYFYFLREADQIICTTKYLAEHLKQFTDKPIEVLPNCIIPEEFPERQHLEKLKIGFAGSPSHLLDLELVLPAIDRLKKEFDIYFEIFGLDVQGYRCKKPVKMFDFPKALADMGMDIGICPLKNDDFNRNKSPIKFLEYAAVGTMALASHTLPYTEEMKPGWLVDDDKWYETLKRFILDKDLRRLTLLDQRAWMLNNRNLTIKVKEWESLYQRILK